MTELYAAETYLDFDQTDHRVIFENTERVWEALPKISSYLQFRLKPEVLGTVIGTPFISKAVYIGKGTVVEHGAVVKGPAWIGENCVLRAGCYIRENVIVGDGCVLGNSSEFKNSLIFNGAEIPHFNYVGDSILGYRSHIGAGVILSNVRLDRHEVIVRNNNESISTGLRKFGAVIGDYAEVGCNSVISPGSLVGRHSIIYPGTQWRGILPAASIARLRQDITVIPRRGIS